MILRILFTFLVYMHFSMVFCIDSIKRACLLKHKHKTWLKSFFHLARTLSWEERLCQNLRQSRICGGVPCDDRDKVHGAQLSNSPCFWWRADDVRKYWCAFASRLDIGLYLESARCLLTAFPMRFTGDFAEPSRGSRYLFFCLRHTHTRALMHVRCVACGCCFLFLARDCQS